MFTPIGTVRDSDEVGHAELHLQYGGVLPVLKGDGGLSPCNQRFKRNFRILKDLHSEIVSMVSFVGLKHIHLFNGHFFGTPSKYGTNICLEFSGQQSIV